ncbi:type II toxin-antitoxin system HicB family antitoxin [Anaerocolumna sp. MB42-C2]|uniref:type II toxin-antitoxin system HicB family antitoxin n=1 Tax=Anaerocolumna sp. MB42-C2 TaxID=3070997 RepID=UPI0027E0E888|nr:type II toxin-antitoxin system HicB family antitoxin [Anaerocolumna sp. MB42-C2]WMJ87713.1 type II toxin-antitoxin system HicB family antitoxin [Anaerocolumna sp. MB42-C2]
MKNRYSFIATFHYAEDGISISFQDLPGCLPCALTTEEALKNAKEALGLHLWGMEQDDEEIPEPTPLQLIHLDNGDLPVLIDVFMPTIRDKVKNQFTKKTLSLPAWLAAEGDANNVNFSKLFQNALMEYLEINDQPKP